jgi:hypothetical protein
MINNNIVINEIGIVHNHYLFQRTIFKFQWQRRLDDNWNTIGKADCCSSNNQTRQSATSL